MWWCIARICVSRLRIYWYTFKSERCYAVLRKIAKDTTILPGDRARIHGQECYVYRVSHHSANSEEQISGVTVYGQTIELHDRISHCTLIQPRTWKAAEKRLVEER